MEVEISFPALLFRVNWEKANFLHLFLRTYAVMKRLAIFPSPAWRESLASDIPIGLGAGKSLTFYTVYSCKRRIAQGTFDSRRNIRGRFIRGSIAMASVGLFVHKKKFMTHQMNHACITYLSLYVYVYVVHSILRLQLAWPTDGRVFVSHANK